MSAFVLKVIACISMLMDHIGYEWNIFPLRIIGRIAFPIFAYLICNGYRYTSNKISYALRLALFALISQIPFSLFGYDKLLFNNGNVFFTLLAGLICIWCADAMRKHRFFRWFCWLPAAVVCTLYHFGIFVSDYGAAGVLTILVFYFCDRKGIGWKVLMVLGYFCARYYDVLLSCVKTVGMLLLGMEKTFPSVSSWMWTQLYSGFALLLIFAYNGKKGGIAGKYSKALQYGFYWFYPVHMLILWIIYLVF